MIKVTISNADTVIHELEDVPIKIDNVIARTVTQVKKQLTTDLQQTMAAQNDIPLSVFKKIRVKSFGRVGGDKTMARVWEGYNPVKAGYIGKPVQEDWGSIAGKYLFRAAFVAKMKSGHVDVFMRNGRARLPIQTQKVALQNAPSIAAQIAEKTQLYYQAELSKQLKKELNLTESR